MSVPERMERASRFIAGLPPVPPAANAPAAPPGSPVRALVVSGDPRHRDLLRAALASAGCSVQTAASDSATLAALLADAFDAVLLDAALADRGDLVVRLAATAPDLPIIALVASPEAARRALRLGAADFAPRDCRPGDVPGIVERNVALESAATEGGHTPRLATPTTSCEAVLDALLSALDTRDTEPEGHAERVTSWTMALAEALGISAEERYDIERGALLHDIGKIGVPDRILLKPGPLTPEEWAEVRRHPVIGFQMCRRIPFLRGAAQVILHHHERWDGAGYPDGLRAEMIPLGARIFAVADAFDAITTDRPHHRAVADDIARQEILRGGGTQFDPAVVDAFLRLR